LRALDYCEDPFELKISRENGKLTAEKLYGLSCKLGYDISETFSEFSAAGKQVYLSCGDSSKTDIRSESVDLVVTDPPFFDNVHYSQLADFFHVWQHFISGRNGHQTVHSTRSSAEVQASDPEVFAERLRGVWAECHRVLRPDGLLVFTYHHSRPDGWHAVLDALDHSGFVVVATHPIKAEMSVAAPKSQAKEPIDLDVIIVCRKRAERNGTAPPFATILASARQEAAHQVSRFNRVGRQLSRNDVRVVLMAQVIKQVSRLCAVNEFLQKPDAHNDVIEGTIAKIHDAQAMIKRASIGG
jgi:adenine-specific DNA methylase